MEGGVGGVVSLSEFTSLQEQFLQFKQLAYELQEKEAKYKHDLENNRLELKRANGTQPLCCS